jgi:hypothetical protein
MTDSMRRQLLALVEEVNMYMYTSTCFTQAETVAPSDCLKHYADTLIYLLRKRRKVCCIACIDTHVSLLQPNYYSLLTRCSVLVSH